MNKFHPEAFLTSTLRAHPRGTAIARILAAAVNAVAPDEAVRRFVECTNGQLFIAGKSGEALARTRYELAKVRRVLIFGLGKAAESMTGALTELLEQGIAQTQRRPEIRGFLTLKHPARSLPVGFEQVTGGHPIPDAGSLSAGQGLAAFLAGISADDLLICLISGGGSALLASPFAGVSLEDMQNLTSALLGCGARIDEINTLRRHLDHFKGGGLARAAAPARVISLILSDVVGSPLEAIASGPTAADPSSRADALEILKKYDLVDKIPPAVMHALETANETPKPGSELFEQVQNVIVGDNLLAARAALQQAEMEGFNPVYLRGDLQGEARQVGTTLCQDLEIAQRTGQPAKRPFCLVAGGETTVTLHGKGRGGRNQELALAAVQGMAKIAGGLLVSLATDGEDGPTDAAGAVVNAETLQRGLRAGLDFQVTLDNNDAYAYFSALDDLLKPGHTGTNVNDLTFLFGL
ncbi:MAG TPA: DUF4147 domain-containing protein [Anaerolineales bacterium]